MTVRFNSESQQEGDEEPSIPSHLYWWPILSWQAREFMEVATPLFCPCKASTSFVCLTCRPDSFPGSWALGDEFIWTAPDGMNRQLTHLLPPSSCQPQVSELIGTSAVLTLGTDVSLWWLYYMSVRKGCHKVVRGSQEGKQPEGPRTHANSQNV